jgi:hypothetical protein
VDGPTYGTAAGRVVHAPNRCGFGQRRPRRVTEEICHAGGLYLRAASCPDAAAKEHLENHWHFHIYWHSANGMVYGHSPILNMDGYVLDGHFC